MNSQEFLEKLADADMVLVGLGEEFDNKRILQGNPGYVFGTEKLKENKLHWMLPAWERFCRKKLSDENVKVALNKLKDLLQEKNYFVVSVSTNSDIAEVDWKHERYVMPCGSGVQKQCAEGCEETPKLVEVTEEKALTIFFEKLYSEGVLEQENNFLGTCPVCGGELILNNIYAEKYNEKGYLPQWEVYRKWLQGTVNRKLLIIELGVGMRYPSVIRWPFEKVAFFNQKAYFCRVNDKLYQLTEELAGKGSGIPYNSIDWLAQL